MSNKKRKLTQKTGDVTDDSLSSIEDDPPKKQSKSENKRKDKTDVVHEKSANGDMIIDLTGKKYICVRQFKGKVYVDIREYYDDKNDGGLKPGKKGISMNSEQWENLKNMIGTVDNDIKKIVH